MGELARGRLIASVNSLRGADDCTEAVLAQERPQWLAPVAFAIGIAGIVVGSSVGSSVVPAAVGAGAGAVVFVSLTTYWILARCEDCVVLARSRKWAFTPRAVELVQRLELPVPATIETGRVSRKVTVAGRELMVARQFEGRLRRVVDG